MMTISQASKSKRMKALTIQQPWAWLIARGIKKIENRSWATMYRGEIAIHAGKGVDTDGIALCQARGIVLPETMVSGAIIAVANLAAIFEPDEEGSEFLFRFCDPADKGRVEYPVDLTWYEGDYGWILQGVQPIQPVPCKGRLGLWEWDSSIN